MALEMARNGWRVQCDRCGHRSKVVFVVADSERKAREQAIDLFKTDGWRRHFSQGEWRYSCRPCVRDFASGTGRLV